MSRYHMFFSSKKAQDELGYTARPWQDAIADAVTWFRNAGYIK
jgi:dihydroflavonol-4-reductase